MHLLRTIRSRLFHHDRPSLHLAVISTYYNRSTERSINLTIRAIRNAFNRTVTVSQYCQSASLDFGLLAREAKETHFDLILALGREAALHARRLYTEQGIFIPTLLITDHASVPHPLPKHFSGLTIQNDSDIMIDVIQRCIPNITHAIVCHGASPVACATHTPSIISQLNQAGCTVTAIDVGLGQTFIETKFAAHAPQATVAILLHDEQVLRVMPRLIEQAHHYQCLVIANDLDAIAYQADIAIGYPIETVADEIAQALIRSFKKPHQGFTPFKARQEVHCRAASSLNWLAGAVTHNWSYTYKIIGSIDSEQSEPSSQSTQTQSARQ